MHINDIKMHKNYIRRMTQTKTDLPRKETAPQAGQYPGFISPKATQGQKDSRKK